MAEPKIEISEISNDEILAAIDGDFSGVAPEGEAEIKPEGEEKPEVKVEGEPEGEIKPEIKPEDEEKPEVKAEGEEKPEVKPEGEEKPEVKAEGEEKPEVKAEGEEKPEVKPEGEEKPSDEFGVLDENTPEKTRERFEAVKGKFDDLVTERDALIEERDEVKAESDGWVNAIAGTGTNEKQFNMTLDYLTAVNSGTPAEMQRAYDIMEGELKVLGQVLGRTAPGHDPLTEHKDLQERIDSGSLEEKDALEIAASRATTKLNAVHSENQDNNSRQQVVLNTAYSDVKALGAQLKTANPIEFNAKFPYLETIIKSAVDSGSPPENWTAMIKNAYEAMPMPTVVATKKAPTVNPLRPGQTDTASSDLNKEPGSILEAVNQSLARGW